MALHQVPDDGTKHLHVRDCPCRPTARKKRIDGMMRTVYAHQEQTPPPAAVQPAGIYPASATAPTYQVPPFTGGGVGEVYLPRPAAGPAPDGPPDCEHVIVDVDGEQQHHDIPDDGGPHAPTSECGCGPQREQQGGHVVYVHADLGFDEETERLYREVFGS